MSTIKTQKNNKNEIKNQRKFFGKEKGGKLEKGETVFLKKIGKARPALRKKIQILYKNEKFSHMEQEKKKVKEYRAGMHIFRPCFYGIKCMICLY